ncbi:hypothetical protein EC843_101891 [Buttiauxella sp. JUb87]|uniref:hypothetical protein n=1 Tax=Buttiauxella sp. JUb87 TaxID=2485129 RepID=UPI00105C1341|nr:hypothetical protein [Buttiauxella sp. JUb87]TDN54833.1 hypothetical protein EC843_101891 [Buttiauxella sp. JUb87]
MANINVLRSIRNISGILCLIISPIFLSTTAAADGLQVSSTVNGLHIIATDKLPSAPPELTTEEQALNCDRDPPQTGEGKSVSTQGWKVIDEVSSGNTTIVGFFSKGEEGTSGSCFVKNGNVAIFNKGILQALIYGDEITDDSYSILGAVSKTNLVNTFRLREFFPGMTAVADLIYDGKVARVKPVAPLEPYCEGTAPVPNIFGKDIKSARKALINYGWIPEKVEADRGDTRARQLNDEGVTEVNSCSGTGFGFCNFDYKREGGASLNVMTVGDDFTVSDYGADCPKQ